MLGKLLVGALGSCRVVGTGLTSAQGWFELCSAWPLAQNGAVPWRSPSPAAFITPRGPNARGYCHGGVEGAVWGLPAGPQLWGQPQHLLTPHSTGQERLQLRDGELLHLPHAGSCVWSTLGFCLSPQQGVECEAP